MKARIVILAAVAISLTGCMGGLGSLPQNSCESGTFSLTWGPFFAQHLTVAGVSKAADGTTKIGNWEGSTSYGGIVTFTQNFHDLIVYPKTQTAPAGAGILLK